MPYMHSKFRIANLSFKLAQAEYRLDLAKEAQVLYVHENSGKINNLLSFRIRHLEKELTENKRHLDEISKSSEETIKRFEQICSRDPLIRITLDKLKSL